MLPNQAIQILAASLVAADSGTLAPAVNANKIALINQPFVPDPSLLLAGVSLATFTGSTPKSGVAGSQPVGNNPLLQQQQITISPPAGGWRFACTADPAQPETIYGYALVDSTVTTLLASALLPRPETVRHSGDIIDLGSVTITLVAEPLS